MNLQCYYQHGSQTSDQELEVQYLHHEKILDKRIDTKSISSKRSTEITEQDKRTGFNSEYVMQAFKAFVWSGIKVKTDNFLTCIHLKCIGELRTRDSCRPVGNWISKGRLMDGSRHSGQAF